MGSHRLLRAVAVTAVVVLSACSAGASEPATSPSPSLPTPAATWSPVATSPDPAPATPTPVAPLVIADLPRVELAEIDATAVCDPAASQSNLEAGEATITCSDGLALAIAVVRATTPDSVTRLYLERPRCVAIPCSVTELSTATVTAWTSTRVFAVELDSRPETVDRPRLVDDAGWPESRGTSAPLVERTPLDGAPPEVAGRSALPYCGRSELGDPPEVAGCFRDAVLDGRAAEVIDLAFGTEGGDLLRIYRFDGTGPLVVYVHDQTVDGDGRQADAWRRSEGALILGITPSAWGFDPWWGTTREL